jgi:hypothetical protein
MDYILGLDLGQSRDPSALAILERPAAPAAGARPAYRCSYLAQAPLGTPYPAVVEQVRALVGRPEFARPPFLALDATGVGRPVVDLFLRARLRAYVRPIVITGGHEARRDGTWAFVPKKDLVGAVVSLLESRRLAFADGLALAGVAREELLNFRAKINLAGSETLEAWREADHDDLVLAIACACWLGESTPPSQGFSAGGKPPPTLGGPPRGLLAPPDAWPFR